MRLTVVVKLSTLNIFNHIIIFTNDRDPKGNKTLANIYEAVEEFKKEYNKPTNFIKRGLNTIKSGWNKYADESRKMGIVADPEGYAMVDDVVGKVKGILSDVLPERAKDALNKAGSNEKYQEVVNGKGVQEAKSGVNRAANKVVDMFAGKRGVDENGEAIRTGGLIHNVVSKGTNLSNTIHGGIKSNKRLNEEWEDILSQFGADNHFEENDSDSLNMQLIVSSANTAMTDGNVSTMDIQNIQTLTSKLSDRDLQRRINQTVIPMMKRNAKGEKDNSSGDAPKSTMGKLLKMALGGLKLFLAPVIGYIKVVLFSVFKITSENTGSHFLIGQNGFHTLLKLTIAIIAFCKG